MNQVVLMGRLTRDPEVRYSQGADGMAIARYNLAVDRLSKKDGQQQADFINCLCFGKTAEFVEKYLQKGMKIAIQGRIQTGSYEKNDGTKVYTTDVLVNNHYFCESRNNNYNEQATESSQNPFEQEFMNIPDGVDDTGLPFN